MEHPFWNYPHPFKKNPGSTIVCFFIFKWMFLCCRMSRAKFILWTTKYWTIWIILSDIPHFILGFKFPLLLMEKLKKYGATWWRISEKTFFNYQYIKSMTLGIFRRLWMGPKNRPRKRNDENLWRILKKVSDNILYMHHLNYFFEKLGIWCYITRGQDIVLLWDFPLQIIL